jgi:HK97 family phage major capsid protein
MKTHRGGLPIHPVTGLAAVYIDKHGRARWPIAGGAPTRLETLAEGMDVLRAEILELDALEEPTDEQVERFTAANDEWDAMTTEHDELVARAERVERVRTASLNPGNVERADTGPAFHKKDDDPFGDVNELVYRSDNDPRLRDMALKAFDSDVKRGGILRRVTTDERELLLERIDTVKGAARHALIHGSEAYASAFNEVMRAQWSGRQAILNPAEAEVLRASMALGNTTGGYTLPTLLDPTLIHTGTATNDPLRQIARLEQGSVNVWHGVSVGNVTSFWTAEAATMTDGSPTFAGPTVTAAKMTSYVTGSYEIFEDSDLMSQLPGLIDESQGYLEGTAFVSGSGTNAPKGIITAISGTAASTVTATTRGAFTVSSSVDVYALLNAVTPRYEKSVQWVANKATFNTINQMSPTGGGSLFWGDLNSMTPLNRPLLGWPIVPTSDVSAAQTSGTVLIVLGDFRQFVIYDRLGTQVEVLQNVIDQATGLPTGQRGVIAHRRVGSDVTDINAFRFLKT